MIDHVGLGQRGSHVLYEEVARLRERARAVLGGDLALLLVGDVDEREGDLLVVEFLGSGVERHHQLDGQLGEAQSVARLAKEGAAVLGKPHALVGQPVGVDVARAAAVRIGVRAAVETDESDGRIGAGMPAFPAHQHAPGAIVVVAEV